MKGVLAVVIALLVAATAGATASGPPGGLTSNGRAVWNFEALLHDTFGSRTVCEGGKGGVYYDFSPKWCQYGIDPYYSYLFPSARHSAFHLARKGPKHVAPIHWNLVRVDGRFVACDPHERTHLIWHNDSVNFALSCREPGG